MKIAVETQIFLRKVLIETGEHDELRTDVIILCHYDDDVVTGMLILVYNGQINWLILDGSHRGLTGSQNMIAKFSAQLQL